MPPQRVDLPEEWVTPEMLRWAREQVGLEVDQAAGVAKAAPEKIRAWESGEESPTLQELEALSEVYDCPVGYFFLESPPEEETPRLDYRGVSPDKLSHLSYPSRLQLRRFTRLVELAASLTMSMDIDWKISLASQDIEDSIQEVVSRAFQELGVTSEARSRLSSAEEAFNFWRDGIEQQGIIVISLRLDPGELRGASLWVPPGPPAILVNHADAEAASGRSLTLLHEYAHLLIKQPGIVCDFRGQAGVSNVEVFANRFAAESMVPSGAFQDLLTSEGMTTYHEEWSDSLLDKLRRPFHASRDTVAILLEDLSLAPKGFYREKRGSWDRRKPWGRGGVRQTKALRKHRELGSTFTRLLAHAAHRSAISKLEVSEILDMKVEQSEKFLEPYRESS